MPTPTQDQEGAQWRADDGSESGASALAAQDADITRAPLTNTRLRILLNSTNDPLPQGLALQYRRMGDEQWRDV